MPLLNYPIMTVDTYITGPIIDQVMWMLLKQLRIDHFFERDRNLIVREASRSVSDKTDMNGNIKLPMDACIVEPYVVRNPKNTLADVRSYRNSYSSAQTPWYRSENIPIFEDPVAAFTITERSSPCTITFEFTVRFKERENARLLETNLNAKYTGESIHNNFDIRFDYPLEMPVLAAVKSVYDRRVSIHNRIPDFVNYMINSPYTKTKLELGTSILDTTGKNKSVFVKRLQTKAVGVMEYSQDQPDAIMADNRPDRWEVKFTYKVQFSHPTFLSVYIPSTIENQDIPPFMIPETRVKAFSPIDLTAFFSEKSYNRAMLDLKNNTDTLSVVRIPFYEDFIVPPHTSIVTQQNKIIMIASLCVDEHEPVVINLGAQIEDIALHKTMVDIIREHGNGVFGNLGIFNITIFENGLVVPTQQLSMEGSNVIIDCHDTTKRYHLVLSEATDYRYVNYEYLTILVKYRWFFATALARNMKHLVDHNVFKMEQNPPLLAIILKMWETPTFFTVIDIMRSNGHIDDNLYYYTYSAYQFYTFISDNLSKSTGKYLDEEFVEVLEKLKLLKQGVIEPRRWLLSANGYCVANFGRDQSNGWGIEIPLRIVDASIDANPGRQ